MTKLLWLAAPLALIACSHHDEPPSLAENADNMLNEAAPAPPPPVVENAMLPPANAAAPAPEPQPDEAQMRDDADATGLTARLPEEETGQPANSADVQR